jgi:hypothetical protein
MAKRERFIIVPASLLHDDGCMVFLTDVHYWAEREQELKKWCLKHDCVFAGMTVAFPDQQTLTTFVLRWQ